MIDEFSTRLKALTREYFLGCILFDEYRAQRKVIFDEIDEKFNHR